jgi:hypothetical protein
MSKTSFLGTKENPIWLTAAIFDFWKGLIKHKQNLLIIVLLAKCVLWVWAILVNMRNWQFLTFLRWLPVID